MDGVTLVGRRYRQNPCNPDWDHDHCEFCGANFMLPQFPDTLHEGYATEDDYRWVCERCFHNFVDQFGWTVIEPADGS